MIPFSVTTLVCNLVIVILGFMTIPLTEQVIEFYEAGNSIALRTSQFTDDWNVVPFVEIITSDASTCPSGYEPVFERVWGDTVEACIIAYEDYFDGAYTEKITPKSYFDDSQYKNGMLDKNRPLIPYENGSYCKPVPANAPIS